MELLNLKEKQEVGLEILKYVDKYCRENDIKYYGAFGTLIGAVRHGGYIPWDDDIDLMMFREDYRKFIEKAAQDFKGKYKCISFEEGSFYLPYIKVVDTDTEILEDSLAAPRKVGVGIDIFPLDYISDEEADVAKAAKELLACKTMLKLSLLKDPGVFARTASRPLKLAAFHFAKLIGWKNLRKSFLKKIEKYNGAERKKYCSVVIEMIDSVVGLETSAFDETVELDFEDMKLIAPKGYDHCLRQQYGDYMQLPPEEKRIAHIGKTYRINQN